MTTHDLCHPLQTGMLVFPGDPEVTIEPAARLQREGFAVARLHLGSHSGTHIDAPAHCILGGRTVDEISLDEVRGPATVIHLPYLNPGEEITPVHIAGAIPIDEGVSPIVLIATGWDIHWGTARYLAHPYISVATAQWLLDAGAHLLGVDTLNPDPSDGQVLRTHEHILGNDHLIIENLRGLTHLPTRVEFTGVPLHIHRGDGSPIRAFADVAEAS